MYFSVIAATVSLAFATQKVALNTAAKHFHVSALNASHSDDNQCSGCAFVGDLRCDSPDKDQVYPRMNNCLFPMYDVVTTSRQTHGLKCFIIDDVVRVVLEPLVTKDWSRLISPSEPCVKSIPRNRMQLPSWYPGGILRGSVHQDTDAQMAENRAAIARDVAKYDKPPIKQPYVIMLVREGNTTARKFTSASKELLQQELVRFGHENGYDIVEYRGDEPHVEAIRLFAHAAAVVGFHGAGFVNVVYAQKPLCVVEMNTFREADGSDKTMGRTANIGNSFYNGTKDPQPGWKEWNVYGVPLKQTTFFEKVNPAHLPVTTGGLYGEAVLYASIEYVTLYKQGVSRVLRMLDDCLKSSEESPVTEEVAEEQ